VKFGSRSETIGSPLDNKSSSSSLVPLKSPLGGKSSLSSSKPLNSKVGGKYSSLLMPSSF